MTPGVTHPCGQIEMKKEERNMKKRVVVFGIFDGIHDGHRFLFEQALRLSARLADRSRRRQSFGGQAGQARGDVELIAVVGRDSFVREFKKKEPKYTEEERVKMVEEEPLVDRAILGDEVPSTYEVIEKIRPDAICLGYDQYGLELDLKEWMEKRGASIPIFRLDKLR